MWHTISCQPLSSETAHHAIDISRLQQTPLAWDYRILQEWIQAGMDLLALDDLFVLEALGSTSHEREDMRGLRLLREVCAATADGRLVLSRGHKVCKVSRAAGLPGYSSYGPIRVQCPACAFHSCDMPCLCFKSMCHFPLPFSCLQHNI